MYLTNIERYEGIILSENLQDFVWDRVTFCVFARNMDRPADAPEIKRVAPMGSPPGTTCLWKGKCAVTVTICGKEFQYKCGNGTFRCYDFINPNEAEIAAIKRLIVLERQARVEVEQNLKKAIFSGVLKGDALKYFEDFHQFLTENKLTAKMATNKWNVSFNGKQICYFKIVRKDYWIFTITLYKNFTDTKTYDKYINADQRKFLLENFRTKLPSGCGNCKGYGKIEFLGNDYETVCKCYPIYTNSNKVKDDPSILEFMKQLTLVNKNVLEDMAAAQ